MKVTIITTITVFFTLAAIASDGKWARACYSQPNSSVEEMPESEAQSLNLEELAETEPLIHVRLAENAQSRKTSSDLWTYDARSFTTIFQQQSFLASKEWLAPGFYCAIESPTSASISRDEQQFVATVRNLIVDKEKNTVTIIFEDYLADRINYSSIVCGFHGTGEFPDVESLTLSDIEESIGTYTDVPMIDFFDIQTCVPSRK